MQADGDLRGALAQFQQVLSKAPSKEARSEIERQIAAIKSSITDSVLAEADRASRREGLIPMLDSVVRLLEGNRTFDDSRGRLSAELNTRRSALAQARQDYSIALGAAEEAERNSSWSPAIAAVNRAMTLNPSADLSSQVTRLVGLRDARISEQIGQLLQGRRLDDADRLYAGYEAEVPRPSETILARIRGQIETTRQQTFEAQLATLIQANKFYTAYHFILERKREYLNARLEGVKATGTQFYKNKAKESLAMGGVNLGYAYFAAQKAWELGPEEPEAFDVRRTISDKINELTEQQISIGAFSSPDNEKESGTDLSNALMEQLFDQAPFGIKILERSKIEELLKETGMARSNLLSKVKMFIVGNVTALTVEPQRAELEGFTKIEKGINRLTNPDYVTYVQRFGPDKSKWPADLQSVQPQIAEPIFEIVRYKYGEERREGIMVVSVRQFESILGEVKGTKVFTAKVSKSDSFSDNPAERKVLRLPSNIEIKETLRKDLADQIGRYVLSSFEHREIRFLQSAQTSIARREFPAAVIDLAGGFQYGVSDKKYIPTPEADPTLLQIRKLGFFDYTE